MKPAFVYFITSEDKYVKIGMTYNVEKRLHSFNIGTPHKLSKHYKIKTESFNQAKKIEYYLHIKFKDFNIQGEWFEFNKEIKNFIEFFKNLNFTEKLIFLRDIEKKGNKQVKSYLNSFNRASKADLSKKRLLEKMSELEYLIDLYNKREWIGIK